MTKTVSENIKKILVIDDEEMVRQFIATLLQEKGFNVSEAENGLSGLEAFKQSPSDMVLVDLKMPEMNGIQFLEKFNKIAPDIPAIVVSGTDDITDAIEVVRQGAWNFVTKPILDANFLYHAVEKAFERVRLLKENKEYQENLEELVKKRTYQLEKLNTELTKSEKRYRHVVEDQTETIMRYIADGTRTFVNDSYCRFFGKTREQLLGTDFHDTIHQDDLKNVLHKIESLNLEKPVAADERRVILSNGRIRWQQWTDRAIFDKDQNIIEYQAVGIDITDRKKGEEALRDALQEVENLKNQLQDQVVYLREEIKLDHNFEEIIGQSKPMKQVLKQVEIIAPNDTTVLVLGETGTGKELIVRAIHNLSARKNRPLVKVNCAALPSNLIESELFGHEKGAFTGATSQKIGRFELAEGSTIFLDEIGELPLDLQAKLLRVLQENEFERVGSVKTIKADVRIITATNRNLEKAIDNGLFREDLYYRLNVVPIKLPSLQERKEDIPLLAMHFAQKFARKLGKKIDKISQKTLDYLQNQQWEGNIRELENTIERAVIFCNEPELKIEQSMQFASGSKPGGEQKRTLDFIEKQHIAAILEEKNWVIEGVNGAASVLGLHPNTLRSRMKKLDIKKK